MAGKKTAKESEKLLYSLLGVESTATEAEIKKAYRLRALSTHPDKQPDNPAAAENFAQLNHAYEVLSNAERRRKYDISGDTEEESETFRTAYDFYRSLFPQVSTTDIDTFAERYRGSSEEKEDLNEFFKRFKGDVSRLLEWIPVSRPEDVGRFITQYQKLMKNNQLSGYEKVFTESIPKLRANAKKMDRLTKKEKPDTNQDSLVAAILGKRSVAQASFIADLENKYAKKK